MRIILEAFTLTEQKELGKANLLNLCRQFPPSLGHRCGGALYQLRGPLNVISSVVSGLQGAEKRVVVEPMCLRRAELFVVRLQVSADTGAEIAPSGFEQAPF